MHVFSVINWARWSMLNYTRLHHTRLQLKTWLNDSNQEPVHWNEPAEWNDSLNQELVYTDDWQLSITDDDDDDGKVMWRVQRSMKSTCRVKMQVLWVLELMFFRISVGFFKRWRMFLTQSMAEIFWLFIWNMIPVPQTVFLSVRFRSVLLARGCSGASCWTLRISLQIPTGDS